MIIELSTFFNNPTLVEIGPLKIQYYAVTWLLSALLIFVFLKNNRIIHEIGLNKDEVNDMVSEYRYHSKSYLLFELKYYSSNSNK